MERNSNSLDPVGSEPQLARTSSAASAAQRALPLPAHRARLLLRKLRDLNLSAARIAVHARLAVSIAGCASLDLPVDSVLRYRVRTPLCDDEELVIGLPQGGGLHVARRTSAGEERASRRVGLFGGANGLATVPELRARIDPDTAGLRETERFLRRLVRAVFPITA